MAWIRTIPHDQAKGELRREYDTAVRRAGRLWKILELQSLNPRVLHDGVRFYLSVMYGESDLTRAQREMIGTAVSVANACHY